MHSGSSGNDFPHDGAVEVRQYSRRTAAVIGSDMKFTRESLFEYFITHRALMRHLWLMLHLVLEQRDVLRE